MASSILVTALKSVDVDDTFLFLKPSQSTTLIQMCDNLCTSSFLLSHRSQFGRIHLVGQGT